MSIDLLVRARAFFAVLLGSALVISTPSAFAQDDADDEEYVEEQVVVTGSRVKRSDFVSASPITVIDGQALLESGYGDIGEALRAQTTTGTAGFNQSSILSGGGATSIDLRNLGQSRVLILINGKRVASFADALANQAADLSFLPSAMVERVEILRDGASAIYGSDAISGVVNIILKEGFEGIEAGTSYGISGEGDAENYTAEFAIGTTSDRGSLMIGGEYRKRDNVNQRDRDWAYPNISSLNNTSFNNGSFFSPGGVFFGDLGAGFCTEPKAIFGGDEVTDIFPNCPSFRAAADRNDVARYDYGVAQFLINENETYSLASYGTYEFTDGIEGFMEFQYSKRQTSSNLDGNPGSFGTPNIPQGWRIPATNPNNPTGEDGSYYIRPSSTIGIRASEYESDTIRLVSGLRGDIVNEGILDGWSWELSYLFTRVDSDLRTDATWNLNRANIISDPALCAGDTICSQVVNPSGALDALRPGNWTDAEIAYLRQSTLATSEFQTTGWFGMATGPIAELPAGEVNLAIGFETRTEEGFNKPDSVTEAGESVANQVFTTKGDFTVDELFAEIDVPVLRDVPGAETLDLNAQVRYSDYSNFGSESVYRFGLNWQAIQDVRVRATASTAYRAPQITDLFGGGTVSFDFFTDPCVGRTPGSDVDANCLADGVPASVVQLSAQYPVLSGSNPDLEPETADTYTIGVIFTPRFAEWMTLSVDYWNIEVENLINRNTSDSVLDACYEGPVGLTAPECDQFDRNPSNFVPVNFVNRLANLNDVKTDGYDVRFRAEFGGPYDTNVTIDSQATYVVENTFYPGAGGADDRGSIPRIVGNTNVIVDWQEWDFRWGIRYIHGIDDPRYDGNNPFGYSGASSHTEHDLRAAYNFDKYRVMVGINDVFDNDPPYVFSSGNNTDLFLYDAIGRYAFLRLSANL
ncbi:MAG: TonB-dependent receptor [Pseudomonadaceae bacterium]|nr:TonB-dependent receptor [Pseudomonadaceae bacterium]